MGPKEYKQICGEANSMRYAINSLCDDAQDPHSLLNKEGVKRRSELVGMNKICEKVIQEFQAIMKNI